MTDIYVGTVRHRRFTVRDNEMLHKVAYALVDLEALPARDGLVSFRATDYLHPVEVRERTGATGPIRLLTMPRIAGLIFNPVSFYYAFEPDGKSLAGVLAEVTNTPWGERHTYLAGDDLPKELHVSPLMPMDQRYHFRAPVPGPTLSVHIESTSDEGKAFDATLNLRRRPFAVAPLLRGSALRTLPLIYVHALALRLRGVPGHPHPRMIARAIVHGLLRRIFVGTLAVTENGRTKRFGNGDAPHAHVTVNDSRAWPLLLKGSSGMGEAYAAGYWDSPDLTSLIRIAARNTAELDAWRQRLTPVRAPFQRLRSVRNTVQQSKHDISAHYDLGNDLYERMLDPTMSYSSAFFAHPDMSLEQASAAKLDLVCDRLELGPSDHVIEIGTGWGGFAIHAARTRGCRVTTTTISREQFALARERVREAGVEHLVTVLDQDYRLLTGRYDKLVSIEMIEAVGWRDFGTFFAKCSDLLEPDGAALIQAITMDDRAYHVEKASRSFIRTFIFPNGCLPSMEIISRNIARRTDLRMTALQDLTAHYPETLRRWRENFDAHADELASAGYDDRFQRIWRLYLSYCEAGFAERRISVMQLAFSKPLHAGATGEAAAAVRDLAAAS